MSDESQYKMRERAVALHRSGKIAEAAALYETLLDVDRANADLWGLLSIAQLHLGRPGDALKSWRTCLSVEMAVPLRLRNIANFLLALRQKSRGKPQSGDFLNGVDIPDWPREQPLDPESKAIVLALARCLAEFGRKDSAQRLVESALDGVDSDPDFITAAAPIMIAGGKSEKMLELLRPMTSGAHRDNGTLLMLHAAAADAAQHRDEAVELSRRAYDAVPVFLTAKMPNQRLVIGVLNQRPPVISEVQTPAGLHFSKNTPATLAARMNDEFRFLSIFPLGGVEKRALSSLPAPQLIINNWVGPEGLSKPNALEFIADYADSFGLPVINHPRNACLTTRQRNAERLAGIPNAVVPRVLRLVNDPEKRQLLPGLVEKELGYPVILRNPFTQMGADAARIASAAELAAYLSTVDNPQLYAIQYIHNPVSEGGAYRKIRAAAIGSELLVIHVHFSGHWSVHRPKSAEEWRNRLAFEGSGAAAAFADQILRRPEETLGKTAMTALREIRDRTPLDFFGIDFDLLPDGRIVFFETNAAMNLGMRDGEDLPETILAMRDAFRRLFTKPPAPASPSRPN